MIDLETLKHIAKKGGAMGWLSGLFSNNRKIGGKDVFEFFEGTIHYHAWLYNGNKNSVWPMVKEVEKKDGGKRIDIIMHDENLFTITKKREIMEFSYEVYEEIEIYYNKNIVACFSVNEDIETNFYLRDTEFINEGVWINYISEFLKWKKVEDERMHSRIQNMLRDSKNRKMNKSLED